MFLHRPAHSSIGSKIMRCDQLSSMAQRALGHKYQFEVVKLHMRGQNRRQREMIARTKGAIVILLKGAEHSFDDAGLFALRETVRGLCIDHVDASMRGRAVPLADVQIAASVVGLRSLQDRISGAGTNNNCAGIARLLTHHADPRITMRSGFGDNRLRLGYFGSPGNTVIPRQMAGFIETPLVNEGLRFGDLAGALRRSNMHYAVRPSSGTRRQPGYKPFTKGFNAASANANILVNREADDALEYLGADYPFLIDGSSCASIEDGIGRAEAVLGTAQWRYGLDIMEDVRRRCAPSLIMEQLAGILEVFD